MKTRSEKAKEIAERSAKARPIDRFNIEFPNIACKKCGREIYCGVNALCADPECEKKK
jgi:hypothetical protein